MDEQFHESRRLDKAVLAELVTSRSDGPALRRFGLQYGLLLGSGGIIAAAPALPIWAVAAAVPVYALMTMGMFALVHESGHQTAFASRRLNRAATWLAGAPIYYAPSLFREFHFAHHRHTNEPGRDPEISLAGKPAPGLGESFPLYLGYLSGQPLMQFKIVMLIAAALGAPQQPGKGFLFYVSARAKARVGWEARAVLALHALLLGAAIAWLPGLWLLLGAQALGHAILSGYLICEHTGLAHAGDIFARTRSTRAHPLLAWLMWNMPYHAEHHAYPAVPWHALPRLRALLGPELLHLDPGYFDVHRRLLAAFARGERFQVSAPVTPEPAEPAQLS